MITVIFTSITLHLALLWNRGLGQLRNSPLSNVFSGDILRAVVDDEASIACSLFCLIYFFPSVLQSLKKKITTYRRAASHYDKAEERNGAETSEPAETLGANDEGGEGKRKMRVRRRRNEANGHAARDEDKDEGLCVTCHIILCAGRHEIVDWVDV